VVEVNERATVQEYDHLRIHPQMNAVRLAELRTLITFLRKRVWYVAHYDLHTGLEHPAPDWGSSRRGWRWQTLLARSRDEVVAKSSATAPHSSVAPAHSSAARLDSESMMRLDAMVRQADALLGMPYVWGGGHEGWGPQSGYDCSGFVCMPAACCPNPSPPIP
jgi:cell wall-associated NlpC family hydrolase